jgi:F-type H+-transporting ATPase subunit alpha
VPEQIAVLLALTSTLFDGVPLERMAAAEAAVRQAAAGIPAEVVARLDSAETLSDDDRDSMLAIAREALLAFQPEAEAKDEG